MVGVSNLAISKILHEEPPMSKVSPQKQHCVVCSRAFLDPCDGEKYGLLSKIR